ncbi:hypothetical protein [Enhygromyxa salina]|uniref:hypothetical protein n=1 Tax=Enhygromyxa salina TaxID=215803 RepID=UPI0015E648FE|nr:hypothetical protein [Enhygromyxa salina]
MGGILTGHSRCRVLVSATDSARACEAGDPVTSERDRVHAWRPGEVLAGKYELLEQIGAGGGVGLRE